MPEDPHANARCLFCRRSRQEAGKLVMGGPTGAKMAYICGACIDEAYRQYQQLFSQAASKFLPTKRPD
jgi:hypothetical protein